MSPEQARGEGHRVDARSDVYSLGVVFYELLTGKRPYRGRQGAELLDEIACGDVRPPRQLDDTVPKELDRICLKALAKRAADRYPTSLDLADDLRHWQAKRRRRRAGGVSLPVAAEGGDEKGRRGKGEIVPAAAVAAPEVPTPDGNRLSPSVTPIPEVPTPNAYRLTPIVPKGLRSFDGDDADFFLQLLPGPTDREGLPESIRFWKSRMERTDSDTTFAVGLSYGPSGCGKSSLFKAGVLPRLAPHVLAVYLEATPDDTEARLLKLLRKACGAGVPPADSVKAGGTPAPQDLVATMAELRRGRGLAPGQKVVIVLDQFEQWLHSHRDQQGTELVRALRQCDGGRMQCVVMVRDDFWMAASQFLRELEIPLVENENSAAVYLFDMRHARKVLALFGRAFGCLDSKSVGNAHRGVPGSDGGPGPTPRNATEGVPYRAVDDLTADQEAFLDAAVADLAEDGKVVSVRLALFAEMVKSKLWTPATLKEIGGTAGVGATFLEETFSASTAPPRHRLHQKSARAVLKALLPETGADIKGHKRSRDELLAASGYANRPGEFTELLRILDAELRLITPADEEELRISDRGSTTLFQWRKLQSAIRNPKSAISN